MSADAGNAGGEPSRFRAAVCSESEPAQVPLALEIDPGVELPRTLAECHQPPTRDEDGTWVGGICPVLRCQYNVTFYVTRNGKRALGQPTETINIGGRGGKGQGTSLSTRRSRERMVRFSDLDRLADAAVRLADALPSTCLIDYIENPDLIPARGPYSEFHAMTLDQIGRVLRVTREAARRHEETALEKVKGSPHVQDWAELVLMLSEMRARREPVYPPQQEKRSRLRELDVAIDESLRAIAEHKQGSEVDVPVGRVRRKRDRRAGSTG